MACASARLHITQSTLSSTQYPGTIREWGKSDSPPTSPTPNVRTAEGRNGHAGFVHLGESRRRPLFREAPSPGVGLNRLALPCGGARGLASFGAEPDGVGVVVLRTSYVRLHAVSGHGMVIHCGTDSSHDFKGRDDAGRGGGGLPFRCRPRPANTGLQQSFQSSRTGCRSHRTLLVLAVTTRT